MLSGWNSSRNQTSISSRLSGGNTQLCARSKGVVTSLKESLTFYASPEGVQSGHFGSALAAAGELAWRRGNYDQAIGLLEKALMVTQSRFGESDACAVIRQNLEMIKKEKEEKGITGAADKKEDKGGNLSHCASCQFKDAKF